MPNNVFLLVDTYDTVNGVRNALKVGKALEKNGHELLGVRLDSGDLVELSKRARNLLDEAGLHDAKVIASNDLDEYTICQLKKNGAKIDVWGIGTKLVTAYDQAALGGVYKLSAIRDDQGNWQPRIKLSNDPIKVSNPGILQVARRTNDQGAILEDILFDEQHGLSESLDNVENLLVPAIHKGKKVLTDKSLQTIRERAMASWENHIQNQPTTVTLDPHVDQTKRNLLTQNGFTA